MAGYSKKRQFVQRRRILRTFSGLGDLDPNMVIGQSGLTVADLRAKGYTDADIEAIIGGIVSGNPGNILPGSPSQLQMAQWAATGRGPFSAGGSKSQNAAQPATSSQSSITGSAAPAWWDAQLIPGVASKYLVAGGTGLFALAVIAGGGRRR